MLDIVKYGNRRLYNRSDGGFYINLSDVAKAVMEGRTVRVTDVKTRTDITSLILLDVLRAQQAKQVTLPVPVIRGLIRGEFPGAAKGAGQ